MKISKTPLKPKIPRILLSLLLFLIIFITLTTTSTPLTAHADSFVTADGTKWTTAPTDLPWAGSAERQGVLFYLTKISGSGGRGCIGRDSSVFPFTLLASNEGNWQNMISMSIDRARTVGVVSPITNYTDPNFHYPATYTEDGSWVSTGGDTKAYLEEETASGRQQWEITVGQKWGYDKVDEIKKDRGETYRICMESTSAFILYCNKDGEDYQSELAGGPYRMYGTVYNVGYALSSKYELDITQRTGSGSTLGTANYKWLQSIANGMVLTDEEEAKIMGVDVAQMKDVTSGDMKSQGYGFGTIKPILTPIHTCNGTTPGDPEKPIPEVTDGKCTIQKLYWTTVYDKDGNFKKRKDERSTYRPGTTNYIVIDSEPGYTVRKWGTSSGPINPTPDNWKGFSGKHSGNGGGEIVMDEEGGEKYLAVWLEKVEVQDKPDEPPYEYIIPQSQITKRISFQDPDNKDTASAEKMQALRKNIFKVHAPGVSECPGHSCGNPYCTSCPHYCSGASWPDNGTKIGIQNKLAKKAPSILSRHQQTTTSMKGDKIADTGNTEDTGTSRGGTGGASLSYGGYRYNCIIFRGKDQLVLADWKNAKYYPESKTLVMMQTP